MKYHANYSILHAWEHACLTLQQLTNKIISRNNIIITVMCGLRPFYSWVRLKSGEQYHATDCKIYRLQVQLGNMPSHVVFSNCLANPIGEDRQKFLVLTVLRSYTV